MAKFRTIEISDSRFESNNLRFLTAKTPNLRGRGDICVFVPPSLRKDQVIPVVILLHGVYGSAWSWSQGTGVHLQALEMIRLKQIPPMVIAMPSDGLWGDGSAYIPHNGYNFEKWIADDIIEVLGEMIDGVSPGSPLFIAGLSMGGFGALRIGAKYGHKFQGISGHSSITNLGQMKMFVEEELDQFSQQDKSEEDVFETMMKYRNTLPSLRFDCGTGDSLLEDNRKLHQRLTENGIKHIYKENPGAHEWPYWEKHISDSLMFFANILIDRENI